MVRENKRANKGTTGDLCVGEKEGSEERGEQRKESQQFVLRHYISRKLLVPTRVSYYGYGYVYLFFVPENAAGCDWKEAR
jgi:hypothetical protein